MIKYPAVLASVLILVCFEASSQKLKKADKAVISRLTEHVQYLADDKLEGRRAGSNGEQLAAEYISNQFKSAGILPKGTQGYLQSFPIYEGKQIGKSTQLIINGDEISRDDFFPFAFSPESTIEAMPAIALQESGMPWFKDLKEVLDVNAANPHFDLTDHIRTHAKQVQEKGATALIVYNSSARMDHLSFDVKDVSAKTAIPVIYVNQDIVKKHFEDESASLDIKLVTDIEEKYRNGHNVVGYIDNEANSTVVLGAHYDHLGFGEDGNSLVRMNEKIIHNGADDNASGTSALIELARILMDKKYKNSNYLFIAFSGEELGLFGSKYFVENPTVDLAKINYMINMDMIGRLNDSNKAITVGGVGTSPSWSFISAENKLPFSIKVDSSGSGPSDHTSFYRKDIPVLFFFTGLHTDYHKPSDDADKVNVTGSYQIMLFITDIINRINKDQQKLAFTKTKEKQVGTTARFSVSLGIMPDYTFSGPGVKADGVTEGRPAHKAGLKTGDIVVQLGEMPVNSMKDYMQALSKFKKGDNTIVKYKRGETINESPVQF